jgi:hypothetical protein
MGGTPHWRRHHVELRSIREKAAIAERRRCERIVEAWNRRPSHDWSPTIGAALKAGYRWLSVYCPGCGQIATVDLERIDRQHRGAPGSRRLPRDSTTGARYSPIAKAANRTRRGN